MNEQSLAVNESDDVLVLDTTEKNLGNEVTLIEQRAEELAVETEEEFQAAGELTRSVKKIMKQVDEYWEPMRLSTKKAYDDVLAHKKQMIDPLKSAEKILKGKIADYTVKMQELQRKREEERKRLAQEEADRKLEEAVECQKNGDDVGMEAAMAEAEIMEEVVSSGISSQSKQPKVEGFSVSKTWKITAVNEEEVPIDINGAVIRPVDQSAIMALIKATKGKIKIPGVTYEETVRVSVRSK